MDLLSTLHLLPASQHLRSSTSTSRTVRDDILRLIPAALSADFDIEGIRPLLTEALDEDFDEVRIWELLAQVSTKSTPPRVISTLDQQTPWRHNTSSFANSSEYRNDIDRVLKGELGPLSVDTPGFFSAFFGGIVGLHEVTDAVFKQCTHHERPLFHKGWLEWPVDADQNKVLSWFTKITASLVGIAAKHTTILNERRPLAQPSKPIQGSTAERKLDIGFVNDPDAVETSHCHWSQILVPGELKSNPAADTAAKAWLDLGRYAREVLKAEARRRFTLGFTLCGSFMRIWEFDRLGGISSERFDINQDGRQFVMVILGFLLMSNAELGFDQSILANGDKHYIEIERSGKKERIILDKAIRRSGCIAGRATTCWPAYSEQNPTVPLLVKDSWQYTNRTEEGELLLEAKEKGVLNIARYYYHGNVQVDGVDDDVLGNVRKGLDIQMISKTDSTRPRRAPPQASSSTRSNSASGSAGTKRPSDTDLPPPHGKKSRSISPQKGEAGDLQNRIHRRVVLEDRGVPIYNALSRKTLLMALHQCVEGHESLLLRANILHRDISINNLLINEEQTGAFLIDLDLAIKLPRETPSGAKGKTGTWAFMAIGALLGEQHSFMHDLESFFWVLFWICIHYDGPGQPIGPTEFDTWNYEKDEKLVQLKLGTIADEPVFLKIVGDHFTPYYRPLSSLINELREAVFPGGKTWKKDDVGLYAKIKSILTDGQNSPDI